MVECRGYFLNLIIALRWQRDLRTTIVVCVYSYFSLTKLSRLGN